MFLGANPFAFICVLAVGFVIEDISSAFLYSRTVWYYHTSELHDTGWVTSKNTVSHLLTAQKISAIVRYCILYGRLWFSLNTHVTPDALVPDRILGNS